MFFGASSRNNWYSTERRAKTLAVIQEEDLEQVLARCEESEAPLRPMPIKAANETSDRLPWCIDIILRMCRRVIPW